MAANEMPLFASKLTMVAAPPPAGELVVHVKDSTGRAYSVVSVSG